MRGGTLATPTFAAVLLALALIPASLPGSAFHVEDPPELLHAGGGSGPGWVMYRFDPAGEHVVIDVEAPQLGGVPIVEAAAMFYNEDLALQFGFAFTAYMQDEGVYVDSQVLGDENPQINTYPEGTNAGFMAMGTEINPPGATGEPVSGTQYVALWMAGGVVEHSHAFYGAEGVELHEVTEGDSAYYYVTQDFEGPFTGRASAGPLGARAVVDGAVDHTVEGNLLGLFSSGFLLPSADSLSVDRPDDTTQSCACFWTELTGPNANGPGDYTLRATGAAATLNSGDHVRASVIDVVVPNQDL